MDEFKKQKWSRKYTCCLICKTDKIKHKGKGLCSQCYDKKRISPKRLFQFYLAGTKRNFRNRFKRILENKGKKEIKCFFKKGDERRIRKNEVVRFFRYKKRGEKLKNEGKNVLQIIKNGKIIYLPIFVEEFERPKINVHDIKDKNLKKIKTEIYEKELKKYKKKMAIFDFCRNFKTWEEIKNGNKNKK